MAMAPWLSNVAVYVVYFKVNTNTDLYNPTGTRVVTDEGQVFLDGGLRYVVCVIKLNSFVCANCNATEITQLVQIIACGSSHRDERS
jgi:hypothetical protein